MFNPAALHSATINTHNPAADSRKADMSRRKECTSTRRIGALAAAALIAASLSVALPLQVKAVPQLDGHGVTAHDGTSQLPPNPDAITVLANVVQGQKG